MPPSPQIISPTPTVKALQHIERVLGELAQVWEPHDHQVAFISAVLWEGVTEAAIEWGRRGGKTEGELVLYALWGQLVRGSQSYLFLPLATQAREIVWAPQKIQRCVPPNWIDEMLDSQMRCYWSGSKRRECWFKLDGSDNEDARRGIEPNKGILGLDEMREMAEEFLRVIGPIRAKWNNPLIMSSTPPDDLTDEKDPQKPNWVIALFDRVKRLYEGEKRENKKQHKYYYSHITSFDNPHLSREFLEDERRKAIERGEEDIFEREYLAMRVPRKTGRQFPMFGPQHIRPHADLVRMVKDHPDDWRLFCMTDPAGADVWAWNLFAVNLYHKRLLCLAEIDETNHAEMVTTLIWPRVMQQMHEIEPRIDLWRKHYDDAEAWFAREMTSKYQVAFNSSEKLKMGKREAFSLIKDLFLADMFFISDSCHHTIWEFQNYENGKSRDHHLDLTRYTIHVSGYTPNSITKPQNIPVHSARKMQKIRQAQVVTESSATGDEAFSGWADSLCSGFE